MSEFLLPPDIRPDSEDCELVDDGTQSFVPQFGAAQVQRAQYFEPYLRITQKFTSLRQADRARMMALLGQLRGKYGTLRALAGYSLRGSFPSTELFTNNTFASGTTGWTSSFSAAVTDRIYRATVNQPFTSALSALYQVITPAAYTPYVFRAAIQYGRRAVSCYLDNFTVAPIGSVVSGQSILASPLVTGGSSINASVSIYPASHLAGDWLDIPWLSFTRCAFVDNGQNLVLYSDQLDNAVWAKTRLSVSANATTAPDGTSTADALIEDSSNNTHALSYSVSISSTAADYAQSFALKANARSWAMLQLQETDGNTVVNAYFNVSSGVVGATTSTGANWTNLRTFVTSLGNGWYQCTIVASKTNTATGLIAYLYPASGDGGVSYAGNGSSSLCAWRGTIAQSSLPVRLAQTISSALTSGTSQTGNGIYLKGLPASSTGLLLPGDPVEIGGELKQAIARLDSDATGLGFLQFAPALFRSPSDGDPVIIANPFGKFILDDTPKWSNKYGVYADLTLVMRAIYE